MPGKIICDDDHQPLKRKKLLLIGATKTKRDWEQLQAQGLYMELQYNLSQGA